MPRYLIRWDAGDGPCEETIEADNIEDAEKQAYEAWLQAAESDAIYGAKLIED